MSFGGNNSNPSVRNEPSLISNKSLNSLEKMRTVRPNKDTLKLIGENSFILQPKNLSSTGNEFSFNARKNSSKSPGLGHTRGYRSILGSDSNDHKFNSQNE